MWAKILRACAKYGKLALQWAFKHKSKLLSLGYAVFKFIFSVWG